MGISFLVIFEVLLCTALTIEELRIGLFRRRSWRDASAIYFPVSSASLLGRDLATLLVGDIFFCGVGIWAVGKWRVIVLALIWILLMSRSIRAHLGRLLIKTAYIAVEEGIWPPRRFNVGRVGSVRLHSSDPETRPDLWLFDRAGQPLLDIGDYCDPRELIEELQNRGVAVENLPKRASGRTRQMVLLAVCITLIWLPVLWGPASIWAHMR